MIELGSALDSTTAPPGSTVVSRSRCAAGSGGFPDDDKPEIIVAVAEELPCAPDPCRDSTGRAAVRLGMGRSRR
jgi:hypothetical protein